jgi:hypothetical protein
MEGLLSSVEPGVSTERKSHFRMVHCPYCQAASLMVEVADGVRREGVCSRCMKKAMFVAFPALMNSSAGKPPSLVEDPPAEGEAACFYSPHRRATKECSHCGVMVSDAWAAAWGSKTVCLKCLDHLRADTKQVDFQSRRVLWDSVVLILAMLPMTLFLYFVVFITAPAALILGFWHWNSPRSLIPRSKVRLVIGMGLGLLQIVGVSFIIWTAIT